MNRTRSQLALIAVLALALIALLGPSLLLVGCGGCAGVPNLIPGIPVARTAAILNSTADSVRNWDLDQDGFLRGGEILGLTADVAAKLLMEARRPGGAEVTDSGERSAMSARELKIPVDQTAIILRASAQSVERWDLDRDGVLKDEELIPLIADLGTRIAAETGGEAGPR